MEADTQPPGFADLSQTDAHLAFRSLEIPKPARYESSIQRIATRPALFGLIRLVYDAVELRAAQGKGPTTAIGGFGLR
jgi:hypothetical protein